MQKTAEKTEEYTMSTRVVHIAGHPIDLRFKKDQEQTRMIQRCMVCGELLIERILPKGYRKSNVPVRFWECDSFVIVDPETGQAMQILPEGPGKLLPEDSCAYLVERSKFAIDQTGYSVENEPDDEDQEDDDDDEPIKNAG